jgi:hypothetical protein
MHRHSTRRVPKLKFTKVQNIGWHVTYRDPETGIPRRFRFGNVEKAKAAGQYHAWLAEHLKGAPHRNGKAHSDGHPRRALVTAMERQQLEAYLRIRRAAGVKVRELAA